MIYSLTNDPNRVAFDQTMPSSILKSFSLEKFGGKEKRRGNGGRMKKMRLKKQKGRSSTLSSFIPHKVKVICCFPLPIASTETEGGANK